MRFDLMSPAQLAQYQADVRAAEAAALGETIEINSDDSSNDEIASATRRVDSPYAEEDVGDDEDEGGDDGLEEEGSGADNSNNEDADPKGANNSDNKYGAQEEEDDDGDALATFFAAKGEDDDDDEEWEVCSSDGSVDEDTDDEEEYDNDDVPALGGYTRTSRQRNWHQSEIMKALKDYDRLNGRSNHQWFVRYVQREYKRPNFQATTLRDWLKRRQDIEKLVSKKANHTRNHAVARQHVGQYPEMEHRLAERIRNMRDLGVPVESWMVIMEGKLLLHELIPKKFPELKFDGSDANNFGFKFSRTWMDGFFERFGFSRHTIGKKMNKKGKCKYISFFQKYKV